MYIANIASSSVPSRWPITWMRQLLNDHVAPDVAPRDLYSVAPLFVRPWDHTTAHTMHELHDARHTDATLHLSFSLFSLPFSLLSSRSRTLQTLASAYEAKDCLNFALINCTYISRFIVTTIKTIVCARSPAVSTAVSFHVAVCQKRTRRIDEWIAWDEESAHHVGASGYKDEDAGKGQAITRTDVSTGRKDRSVLGSWGYRLQREQWLCWSSAVFGVSVSSYTIPLPPGSSSSCSVIPALLPRAVQRHLCSRWRVTTLRNTQPRTRFSPFDDSRCFKMLLDASRHGHDSRYTVAMPTRTTKKESTSRDRTYIVWKTQSEGKKKDRSSLGWNIVRRRIALGRWGVAFFPYDLA